MKNAMSNLSYMQTRKTSSTKRGSTKIIEAIQDADHWASQLQWRVTVLEQGLSQLGQALLILSQTGEPIFTSANAENLLEDDDGLSITNSGLTASANADQLGLELMISLVTGQSNDLVSERNLTLHIQRPSGKQPYHIRMMPLEMPKQFGHDQEKQIIVIIRDLDANFSGWCARLKETYQLTPRECECTILLTENHPHTEISKRMNISDETLRQHMKNIYKKMGVQKQHELICNALEYRRKR